MTGYHIHFPDGFDDIGALIEDKGWCNVVVEIESRKVELSFFDPVVLIQMLKALPSENVLSWFGNVVVVSVVNRSSIEGAVERLYARGVLAA